MRERIYWWSTGAGEWLLDLPCVWRRRRERVVERLRRQWWSLSDSVLDLLQGTRGLGRAVQRAFRGD